MVEEFEPQNSPLRLGTSMSILSRVVVYILLQFEDVVLWIFIIHFLRIYNMRLVHIVIRYTLNSSRFFSFHLLYSLFQ